MTAGKQSPAEKLAGIKVDLRAILQSAGKAGLTAGEVLRDYEDITYGCKIVLSEVGWTENDDYFSFFMKRCRDCMRFDKDTKKFMAQCDSTTWKLQSVINRTRIRVRKRNKRQDGTVRASRMVDTNPGAGPGYRSRKTHAAGLGQKSDKFSRFPTAGESYRAGQVKRPVMHCNRAKNAVKKQPAGHPASKTLPPKMQKTYVAGVRAFQMNNRSFEISKIDDITHEISNGKKSGTDFGKYGFKSAEAMLQAIPGLNTVDGCVVFRESEQMRDVFLGCLDHCQGKMGIEECKDLAKKARRAKQVKALFKEFFFETMEEYFRWIAFTHDDIGFDAATQILSRLSTNQAQPPKAPAKNVVSQPEKSGPDVCINPSGDTQSLEPVPALTAESITSSQFLILPQETPNKYTAIRLTPHFAEQYNAIEIQYDRNKLSEPIDNFLLVLANTGETRFHRAKLDGNQLILFDIGHRLPASKIAPEDRYHLPTDLRQLPQNSIDICYLGSAKPPFISLKKSYKLQNPVLKPQFTSNPLSSSSTVYNVQGIKLS